MYRSQTPLLAVLDPVAAIDLYASMAEDFNVTSHLAHWVFASCETGVMPGSHGLAVMADFKGVPGPSPAELLPVAVAALAPQDSEARYAELGFVAVDVRTNGASLTLDYAYDDAVGAVVAAAAGDTVRAAAWRNRSRAYANIWNPSPGAMCPRFANGTFPPCPELWLPPCLLNDYYTEGDGLQYTWSVPHDLDGLRRLFPSDAAYTSLLQQMMVNTTCVWLGGCNLGGGGTRSMRGWRSSFAASAIPTFALRRRATPAPPPPPLPHAQAVAVARAPQPVVLVRAGTGATIVAWGRCGAVQLPATPVSGGLIAHHH